ncbi:ABC transporter substrate-binding protein [Streptomyces acidiscabies]|uniref:ABC transporter substrate-binding protein n=1 Tax=Streptomyces acidiscabies TaxID=42234 RepID=UPI0038F7EB4A
MSIKRPVAAALCLLTAACGASPAEQRAGGTAEAGYPVTLTNCGQEVTFTRSPRRVVVMNGASVAEVSTLLALGLKDRIVANQQSYGASEVPGRAAEIKALPTGNAKPNDAYDIPRESMLALRPDLVLSVTSYGFEEKNGFATRGQLRTAGANSYVSPAGCDQDPSRMTVADSYRLLRDMGKVFGVPGRAERLITASRAHIASVTAKVAAKKKPNVMVLFSTMSMGTDDFSSVVSRGIFNDILAKAGATNAFANAASTTFADLSKEKAAATSVDALVVIAYNDPNPAAYAEKLLKEFPQWPAARSRTYVTLSDSMYLGPSNDLAVEKIARTLHPEAF